VLARVPGVTPWPLLGPNVNALNAFGSGTATYSEI